MASTTLIEVTPTVEAILEAAGVDDASILESNNHLIDAVSELRGTERALGKTLEDLRHIADRVERRVVDGRQLNGLGELQADGPKLDALIAERQTKIEALTAMVKMSAGK